MSYGESAKYLAVRLCKLALIGYGIVLGLVMANPSDGPRPRFMGDVEVFGYTSGKAAWLFMGLVVIVSVLLLVATELKGLLHFAAATFVGAFFYEALIRGDTVATWYSNQEPWWPVALVPLGFALVLITWNVLMFLYWNWPWFRESRQRRKDFTSASSV